LFINIHLISFVYCGKQGGDHFMSEEKKQMKEAPEGMHWVRDCMCGGYYLAADKEPEPEETECKAE
jgi:hypothetical protein